MPFDSIGEKMKSLRKERKLTLKSLAEQTGVSISFLSQVERGKSSVTLESLKASFFLRTVPKKIQVIIMNNFTIRIYPAAFVMLFFRLFSSP